MAHMFKTNSTVEEMSDLQQQELTCKSLTIPFMCSHQKQRNKSALGD